MSEKRPGFLKRGATGAVKYVGRRFGNPFINEVGRDTLMNGAKRARTAMAPAKFDRNELKQGYGGRYKDGGRQRFKEVMREQGVSDAQLPDLAKHRRKSAGVMYASAAAFLLFGAVMMIHADTLSYVVYGFSTAFVALVFVALGVKHDFSRWQIENRRFGGFSEFLKGTTDAPEDPANLPGKL